MRGTPLNAENAGRRVDIYTYSHSGHCIKIPYCIKKPNETATTSGQTSMKNFNLNLTSNTPARWTNIGFDGQWIGAVAEDPNNILNIYVFAATGMFKTIKGGATWSKISNGLPSSNITSLAID